MEKIGLAGADFWEGEGSLVLSNPALERAPAGLREVLPGHVIFRTSGSEGEAKYVALSKRALLASAEAVNRHLGADHTDRWLRALPVYHVGGFAIHARAFTAGGDAVCVMGEKWDACLFAEVCVRERVTLTSLVPRQVLDLVDTGLHAPETLRAVIVGGGSLSTDAGVCARERGWPVLQSYGMTEAGSQVATQGLDSLEEDFDNGRLPILDHWEARLNREGVLELRGEALLSAYLKIGDSGGKIAVADPKVEGWFRTGDRVSLGEKDGRRDLTFLEREGEMVKILGELVSLGDVRRRVEDVVEHGEGREVTVVGVEDGRLGVRLVLVHSEAISGAEAERLGSSVNAGLPGYARIVERRRLSPGFRGRIWERRIGR